MKRRDLLKSGAALAIASASALPSRAFSSAEPSQWQGQVKVRLNQGPFDIDQDEGWQTILYTTPTNRPLRNPGLGLVGYTWEENGPSLAAAWGIERWSTNLNQCLADPDNVIYLDAQATPGRRICSLFEPELVSQPWPTPVLGTGPEEGAW
jgi:hypothetical protein